MRSSDKQLATLTDARAKCAWSQVLPAVQHQTFEREGLLSYLLISLVAVVATGALAGLTLILRGRPTAWKWLPRVAGRA